VELTEYRNSPTERARVGDLMDMLPGGIQSALDIGARDGHLSRLLADRLEKVVALDLQRPVIDDARVECVQGDATALAFEHGAFDLVLCAEVLEHLPGSTLERACAELARVSGRYLLIGVPYKQDLRLYRSTCQQCGALNPPWGHVNSFDETRLGALFPGYQVARVSYVGQASAPTNALSTWLMDRAGNPYGTYSQAEGCVACGRPLGRPRPRTLWQRCLTRSAALARSVLQRRTPPQANWIHVLFKKQDS
jgi:SAM-dependent methyltransferase